MMKKRSIWPTMALGIAVGAAAAMVAGGIGGERGRRKIKRQAENAMRTVGEFARDLTDMIKP